MKLAVLGCMLATRVAAADTIGSCPTAELRVAPHASVRAGIGGFTILGHDDSIEGWPVTVELAAEWRTVMLHASVGRYSDDYDDGDVSEPYDVTVFELGARRSWHPMPRLTIAAGAGISVAHLDNPSRGTTRYEPRPLVDALVAIELIRTDRLTLSVFDRVSLAVATDIESMMGGSLFGIGASFRP